MKKLILFIAIGFAFIANGQKISLGKDTTFCSTFDTMRIGDNLSIQGSNLGMEYLWSFSYQIGSKLYNASYFLENTTIPNPKLKNSPPVNEWLKFVLTATQNGNVYKDSINIRVSQFAKTLGYTVSDLAPGDSALFNYSGVGRGIPPLSFVRYEPSIGLRDPNSPVTYCIQTLTAPGFITYYSVIKDSVGCVGGNMVTEIRFKYASSLSEVELSKSAMYLKDNHLHFDNLMSEEVVYHIFNMEGKLFMAGKTKAKMIALSKELRTDELLICKLHFVKSNTIETQKIQIK